MDLSVSTESFGPAAHPLPIGHLRQAYRSGALTPGAMVRALLQRIAAVERDEVWTARYPPAELQAQAARLDDLLSAAGASILDQYPLFGVPFAVKDNIDVSGLPTTAACPEFAYVPGKSATAVQRLVDGHALPIGKTNLDQFATGLVGTRSPFGAVRNALDPRYIAGGSSSGSAVAVALGLCGFALGTDTAGSGRVPAGLNGIVGLKPSRGLVSTAGVVPACRSLDCVSIFALQVPDAWQVLQVIAGADAADVYSRSLQMSAPSLRHTRIGLPDSLEFFGDARSEDAYRRGLGALAGMSACQFEQVDIGPLLAAADLLYQGPWIAERRAALGDFFVNHAQAIDPIVREAIALADRYTATDAFLAEYRMAAYRKAARRLFERIDVLMVPTAPNHPTIEEVQSDPVGRNAQLGFYTNFVNLLDLAALAIPLARRSDGMPFGLTLIGPAGSDHRLAVLGAAIGEQLGTGAAGAARSLARDPLPSEEPAIDVAVVGAHLDGQPLNWQLIECGAHLRALTRTAPSYRLYALPETRPAKPGLVRSAAGGVSIEVEVWSMPQRAFGRFIGPVGPPLGIGSVELADGRWVKGFICEPCALAGAGDISEYGGWRAYLAARAQTLHPPASAPRGT